MRIASSAGLAVSLLVFGCKSSSIDGVGGPGPGGVTCGNWSSKDAAPALWSKHAPSGTSPSLRWLHSMAYDAAADRMIVFGGLGNSAPTNDLWVLSNASGADGTPAWATLTAGSTSTYPAPRDEASTAYDEANHILMMYGGTGADDKFISDMWLLSNADGASGTPMWVKFTPTSAGLTVRFAPSLVYNPASNALALFGGLACDPTKCTEFDEVWRLSNANGKGPLPSIWTKVTVTGAAPKGRSHHSAVYDGTTGAMIVFGGETSTSLTLDPKGRVSDTWVLSNVFDASGTTTATWKKLAATNAPPGLGWHAAVYDPGSNRMTIFGGAGADNYVHDDVWVLTNANGSGGVPAWGRLNTGAPLPPARDTSAIYSREKNRLVIFGGYLGDTKLANDAWVLRYANGVPSAKPAKVTVSASSKTVCVGYGMQLVAAATDVSGAPVEGGLVTWTTNNPATCEVDPDGWLTVYDTGSCEVSATLDGVISDPAIVSVVAPAPSTGGDETWIVQRPDGAQATITISSGNVTQVAGKAWTILNNTGDCSFAVALSGTIASGKWQVKGEGTGCDGYHTSCTLTGSTTGTSASGPLTCDNDTPGGSIRDTGTWTATKL